ncbi:RutC family protein YjgH [Enterobacter hormaechei]|nr:RutC family protein YjgH [Enterobacter hormaechei]VAK86443.1 RutC family protein YjgH [Enterobacter hormaechei]
MNYIFSHTLRMLLLLSNHNNVSDRKGNAMHPRNPVFPANRHALYEEHGYSAAIRSGDLLFVSGQVGSRSDGTPEPDFAAQVQLAFDNLQATLAAAGCTFDDLIDVTTFHTDPENQFPVIMEVKKLVFPQPPYPNWTAIGVNWLAGFDFEIKVIARIPSPAN